MNNILNFDDYLFESNSIYTLKPDVKTKLLELDEKYHKLTEKFRTKYVATTCSNLREEFDKFMSAKNMGQKYYPQLEIENSNVDNKLIENFEKLKDEFKEIKDDCYIVKFYLEKIEGMLEGLDLRKKLETGEMLISGDELFEGKTDSGI